MQGREDLRHNQRRPGALQGAGRQQGADAVRHPAQQGSDAKEGDAPHKQAPAAIVIAKLTAHRQQTAKATPYSATISSSCVALAAGCG